MTCSMTSRKLIRLSWRSGISPLRRARRIPASATRGSWYHPMNLFPRKFARWQSIEPYARSLGALMQRITHLTVASMTRMVNSRRDLARASMVAQPLIRKLLVHSVSFLQRLKGLRRQTRSLRRAPRSASVSMTVTVVTLTPLYGAHLVAHGGTTVVNLC